METPLEKTDISVIIPTRNRAAWLPTCLAHLEQQSFPAGRFEVLVIDDGSTDDTTSVLARYAAGAPVRIRWLTQDPNGMAAACNLGAAEAAGRVLLMIQDDELVSPRLLEQHQASHDLHGSPACIMGDVRHHPQLPRDTFTRLFLDPVGGRGADSSLMHFLDWHPSNYSIERDTILAVGGFDASASLRYVAVQELAYRFEKFGVAPRHISDARVYVWQPATFAAERFRQYKLGYGLRKLQQKTGSSEIKKRFQLHQTRAERVVRALTIPYYIRACNRHDVEGNRIIGNLYKQVLLHDRLTGYQDACQKRSQRPPAPDQTAEAVSPPQRV